jgi:hypothetical protein
MRKILSFIILFSAFYVTAQVRMTGTNTSAVNSSAFIDASSQSTNNASVDKGKGLVFPRVNLETFTFASGTTGIATSFPSRYDGMVVYNTASSGVAGVGTTEGTLTPGFWFYENKSTSITGGTWKPLGAGEAGSIKDITATEVVLDTKIDGAQLYAIKGSFTATGTSSAVTITKPTGMSKYYTIVILKDGMVFRNQIISFDVNATTNNVITGSGLFSEVYPAGTYDYVLEYFK